ncbi:MAG TPA: iron-containing alcohol dehydrogenase, partial [Gemmatimonadales bacterium]|nr:iron-containing alcohol dehydrogenase [Gemmatimonadales bacterium]
NAPADRHHALQMQIAACMGGLALSHSRTGIVHQMARPLGARFHVPHGLANAVLLPWCVAFTHTSNAKRFARLASALGAWQEGDDDFPTPRRAATPPPLSHPTPVPAHRPEPRRPAAPSDVPDMEIPTFIRRQMD